MVPFKNVTVSVFPKTQALLADNTLDNTALAAASATGVHAFLDLLTPGELFADYNVVLSSPALIHCEIADILPIGSDGNSSKFPPDSELLITAQAGAGAHVGTKWRVHGRADIRDEGLQVDHATFIIDRMTYPL